MTDLVDVIRAFHNAFRNDLQLIDVAARDSARGKAGLAATLERFRFFNEILVWHAHGEELGVFPAMDAVAPLVSEAYVMDHRGLDVAYDAMNAAYTARDPLETARAAAAFRFHLEIHLGKEDVHLYRIFRERVSPAEQGKVLGIMARSIPQDRFPETVAWLFPLIGHDDRAHVVRIWQTVMPPPVFAGVKGLVQKAVGNDWAVLAQRIPGLEGM